MLDSGCLNYMYLLKFPDCLNVLIVRGNTIKEGEILYVENKYKAHQLTKHAKISYFIVSLVFCTFSCQIYRNGLNRVFSKLRYSKYLKKYESHQFDTFCWESSFQYTLAQSAVPQKFIYLPKTTGHHFSLVTLKSKNKDARP